VPIKRLTDQFVERVAPPAGGRRVEYFDAAFPALSLRVSQYGHKSWWIWCNIAWPILKQELWTPLKACSTQTNNDAASGEAPTRKRSGASCLRANRALNVRERFFTGDVVADAVSSASPVHGLLD
jgi:hypothetical protein